MSRRLFIRSNWQLLGSDVELNLHYLMQLGFKTAVMHQVERDGEPLFYWLMIHPHSKRFIEAYASSPDTALCVLIQEASNLLSTIEPPAMSVLFTKLADVAQICLDYFSLFIKNETIAQESMAKIEAVMDLGLVSKVVSTDGLIMTMHNPDKKLSDTKE